MKIFTSALGWFLIILTPVLLLMTAIRIIFTPMYPKLEYRAPGFPPDPYGFSLEDRLYWSKISIDYILDNGNITLEDQVLPDGSPLYNDRELSHMRDVKDLFRHMIRWWYGLIGIYTLAGIFFLGYRRENNFYGSILNKGGWMTILLIFVIIIFTFSSFNQLFTQFHRLFFQGNSWIFFYSDTLIRLFPIRFWQDAFILMGTITLLEAGAFIWIGKKIRRQVSIP